MASLSAILELINLTQGESSFGGFGNWGDVADENFRLLELAAGEVVSKTLTSSDVTLTDDEHNSLFLKLSGTLSANVNVETQDRKGFWLVTNTTTGDFSVTLKTDSGTGVVIPQGGTAICASDGTNIVLIASLRSSGAAAGRPVLQSKAAGYTAGPSDDGAAFEHTAALTMALKPAALLGNGWACAVKATTGATVIDPDSTEQINGANTITLAEGTSALVYCTGTAFRAFVLGSVSLGGTETLTNKDISAATNTYRQATESAIGAAELATSAEVVTGTDEEKIVTPAGLANAYRGVTQIWMPASVFSPQAVGGAAFSTRTVSSPIAMPNYAFDQTSAEHIIAPLVLPKRYNNDDISLTIYWTANGGTAGQGVQWGASLNSKSNDQSLNIPSGSFTTNLADADVYLGANDLHIAPEFTVSGSDGDPSTGDLLWLRISRDPSDNEDTLAADAEFIGVLVSYVASAGNDA